MTSYLVPARDVEVEIEVKRSRFLCTLHRVESEADARALVERLRKHHWDARHTCSAFIIGPPPQPLMRSNDDGEPAGTAGAPMLEVLRGAAVSDVAAVVTRWFGGILLGTGGLARAYADAVREAVDSATTLRRDLVTEFNLDCTYDEVGRLENSLRASGHLIRGIDYTEIATIRIGVTDDRVAALAGEVANLTGGVGILAQAGRAWMDAGT